MSQRIATSVVLLFLPVAALCGAQKKDDQQSAAADRLAGVQFAKQLAVMSAGVAVSQANEALEAVDLAQQANVGSAWVLWDMLQDLRHKKRAGQAKSEPDAVLVDTYIRLRMRCNTGDLAFRGMGSITSSKFYPQDEDFSRAAKEALEDIRRRAVSWGARQDPLELKLRAAVQSVLETARHKMVFRLRKHATDTGKADDPTPPTPNEQAYIQKVLDMKQSSRYASQKYLGYTLPPWPQSRQEED
jgi:hypothetical protein